MRTLLIRGALPAAAAAAALCAAPAYAEHPKALLAHTPSGGVPNAPAADVAISGDGRIDRYAAYTSAATDIVPGSGAHRNVYVVYRAKPFSLNGTPWRQGKTVLISKGRGGPANGDSWGATFDGYDYAHAGREITVAPKCMAFVSAASNLVGGDSNGRADVFVRRMSSGKLTRIASPGAASEVALDGLCRKVAYIAGGAAYVKNANGSGRARRVSPAGGASSPDLSANGKILTFARNGSVYVNRGGGSRKISAGTQATSDQWGRYVAFSRGGDVWQANITGRPGAHVLEPDGAAPSMTAGGHFVFYVTGSIVTSNVYRNFATCPNGAVATEVAGSPHGNYAAFACSTGQAYLSYVGGR